MGASPVLLNGCLAPGDKRVKKEKGVDEGVIMTSMRWGLVPSWHTSDPRNFLFNTVNCRVEECMERRSFKGAIAAGRRCVVPAEGDGQVFFTQQQVVHHSQLTSHPKERK
ncbi:hypothetical protein IscW_ISCW013677 [Ixodes scapularis]|uniref:Abasic site processing protein HMCES n=1 Tax=Ixodes scapularis TaxID=6945 RepID=B7QLK7_IXOSC|nr:hypothetical protein IscW_ISCW013677 [Ixodes scapularis]|eukprot:XP_002416062.1 hypothetical protein IscW_ISCW013677 [Ixodes scapularis]